MKTILYTHPAFFEHNPGPGHPESPARLRVVLNALDKPEFAALERREAPLGTVEQVQLVHDPEYIDLVLNNVPSSGYFQLDPDTVMSPGSGEAIMRGVGAMCAAVDAVLDNDAERVFVALRPCGHHAEADRAMGFCLFNQVAVAAAYAHDIMNVERVAIVDFDVHHGNGTQHMFERRKGFLYASTHQSPFYPGTGSFGEKGIGNIVNVPLFSGAGSAEFREAFEQHILPALETFSPHLLFISAGFDAHRLDPLASLNLDESDYEWVTRKLVEVAQRHSNGKIISMLEGGYSLEALGKSVAVHVKALMTP